eukprot:304762-Prymnesium_polylepis.1
MINADGSNGVVLHRPSYSMVRTFAAGGPHSAVAPADKGGPANNNTEQKRRMAAPPIAVERFRVEHGIGFTMSVVSLVDRRAAGNRVVRFVFQRHLEA